MTLSSKNPGLCVAFSLWQVFEHPSKQHNPWPGQSTSLTPGDQQVDFSFPEQLLPRGGTGHTSVNGNGLNDKYI